MNRTHERYLNKILLEAVEKELQKDELLQEGFMDFLNKINPFSDSSEKGTGKVETEDKESSFFDGHLVLDAVALVSSFIPGAGSVVSYPAVPLLQQPLEVHDSLNCNSSPKLLSLAMIDE